MRVKCFLHTASHLLPSSYLSAGQCYVFSKRQSVLQDRNWEIMVSRRETQGGLGRNRSTTNLSLLKIPKQMFQEHRGQEKQEYFLALAPTCVLFTECRDKLMSRSNMTTVYVVALRSTAFDRKRYIVFAMDVSKSLEYLVHNNKHKDKIVLRHKTRALMCHVMPGALVKTKQNRQKPVRQNPSKTRNLKYLRAARKTQVYVCLEF